jgi:hypothetical protein
MGENIDNTLIKIQITANENKTVTATGKCYIDASVNINI